MRMWRWVWRGDRFRMAKEMWMNVWASMQSRAHLDGLDEMEVNES